MKIGIISTALPAHAHSVFGIHKRLSMFIEALTEVGELDALFYARGDLMAKASFAEEMKERLLREWGTEADLHLCSFAPETAVDGAWQEYIRPAFSMVHHFPYCFTAQSEQVRAVRSLLSRKPDILFVHRLSCMMPVLLAGGETPPIYFDMDDVEHVAFARSIGQPPFWRGKPLLYLRLPILMWYERRAVARSRATFVCSPKDARYISLLYRAGGVVTVPNAVDIPPERPLTDRATLLFLGFFSYAPNAVAADHLIRDIWPLILSAEPGARLLVAGAHPDRIGSFKVAPRGVEFPGFVNDLDALYRQVRVVCCPILSGGGTRIKILEAAAYGKPVVSTTVGAEGIGLRDGGEIFLRDDPVSFAEACIRLIEDRRLAEAVGSAARSAVAKRYSRSEVVKAIGRYMTGPHDENKISPMTPGPHEAGAAVCQKLA